MYHRSTDSHSDSSISISIGSSPSSIPSGSINSSRPHNSRSMASRQWKQFQREFYSFVFSTTGKAIILVGIIFAFYFLLGIIAMWSSYMTGENAITTSISTISSINPFCTHGCSQYDYTDNIKGTNMEALLAYQPMDIVYTWVNGNDPNLQSEIDIFKRRHEIQEHLAKDPNWTQPIGIQFTLVLNGGIVAKWKNEYFDVILRELERSLERVVRDHQHLIVHRPNNTVTISNATVNGNDSAQLNGSIESAMSNIAAMEERKADVMESDSHSDDDLSENELNANDLVHDEGRRLLDAAENQEDKDEVEYNPRSLRDDERKAKRKKSENEKRGKHGQQTQKRKNAKTSSTISDGDLIENNDVQRAADALQDLSGDDVDPQIDLLPEERSEIDPDLQDLEGRPVDAEYYEEEGDYELNRGDLDREDVRQMDDEYDDELGTAGDKRADIEHDHDSGVYDDVESLKDDLNQENDTFSVNVTLTNATTKAEPFVFTKFWKEIKLRSVSDFDESNAFCYDEDELRQILYDREHAINTTNTTRSSDNVTESGNDEKSKLLLIGGDAQSADLKNESMNTNSTINGTAAVASSDSSEQQIVSKSYCIELNIEIVHLDQFGANQTLPFMEMLIDNQTYWDNFTRNVDERLLTLKYSDPYAYSSDPEPSVKAIHKLFEFKRFSMINHSTDISLINVSEVSTGGKGRYRDNEELRYSLRSVWQFAPWIRNIYIVTNGQVPSWLNLDSDKIWVVTHEEIFQNVSHLPTFASPSIEANIHRIPGLSNRFLYLNDDVMFGNDVYPDDFWKLDGTQYFFPSWEPPKCSDGCPNNWLHDGYCDSACNTEDCGWDAGDCLDENGENTGSSSSSSGKEGEKAEDRYCVSGCPMTWVGDKVCDRACQDMACAFDGGDCGLEMMRENKMFGVTLDPDTGNGSRIKLKEDVMTFYVDFSSVFEKQEKEETTDNSTDRSTDTDVQDRVGVEGPTQPPTASPTQHPEENMIKTAQLDHKDMVRTAIITQSERLLAVVLQPHSRIDEEEEVVFDIGGIKNGEEVHWIFTVHRDAPEKKLNEHSVQKKMDYILKNLNVSNVHQMEVKQDLDDPKATKEAFKWTNASVIGIEQIWQRIEDETAKEEEKQSELKGVVYRKLFVFAGNNTVWIMESDDRLKALLRTGYDEWMQAEAQKKRQEANATGTGGENGKPKAPTLPPYLWDEDIMYKYEDDFFLDEGGEYGMDMDYYYDDYDGAFDDGFYDRRRRNLLNINTMNPILFDEFGNARLDGRDRIKMLQRESFFGDEDHRVMIELGLVDEDGNWLPSKAERDWVFLPDFKEQMLSTNADQLDDDAAMQLPVVDGYIKSDDSGIIMDDIDGNANLSKMKLRAKEKMYESDAMRIRQKLETIFERNSMASFPWIMKDLTLYVFHAKLVGAEQHNASPNRRTLLDTFGDSLRFVSRILNQNFGSETRYVPAHMPHAIDREILIELVDRFPEEYAATSSHRFRSRQDMQWSFSYFYYMMSAKYNFSDIDYIYKEWLDRDRDGILNDYELERMINEVLIKEATKDAANADLTTANATVWRDFFHKALWNITRQLHDLTYWHPLQITVYSINYTTVARDYLLSHFNNRKKFRFEKKSLDDVEFYMIKDKPHDVKERLDHMYGKKPKFMCLNDDLPHDRDPSNETLSTMKSFFTKYYPYPSPFEIVDPSKYHPYIRKGDMVRNGYWKQSEWSLSNNKHYQRYNDRVQVKRAKKNNLYKRRRLQMYDDHSKGIGNGVKSMYNSFRRRRNQSESSNRNGNYSYHIANDMPLPGEANNRREQIRSMVYQTVIRRFRGQNWFIQFVSLFVFCSVVVTVVLQIVDLIRYWLSVTFSWVFTNNPTLFECCKWFSFNSWFGTKETKHSD